MKLEHAAPGFRRLRLTGWRQFDTVDITLHPRLTIITGANGAGKSSILKIFTRHFGYVSPFLATPILGKDGGYTYSLGLFVSLLKRINPFQRRDTSTVGELTYGTGVTSELVVPNSGTVEYHLSISAQQNVPGIHIDSHQPLPHYQMVGQIPAAMITPEHAYSTYNSEYQNRYQGSYSGYSPMYRMKEAIIAMAMFGEGNSRSPGNPTLRKALDGFVEVLRKVLPPSLGFLDLSIRTPEVVIQTRSGEFVLDAASGGVATLIDISWRLHLYSLSADRFVVTIDEPENHLHPSMQRSLMRRLLEAFPKAQFIVATHSPFIVSSVKDSSLFVLRYQDEDGRAIDGFLPETTKSRVVSTQLDTVNKSASANEILRDVLGVEATVAEWVTESVQVIVAKYGNEQFTPATLERLREELRGLGYEDQYPIALAELMKRR